jgi:hypothetical protein
MSNDGSVTSGATQHPITAVDIALEPDATMIQNAQAANAGLLKNFPKGYSLGDEHAPHMSVIGGYFTQRTSTRCSLLRAKCWPARR